jgi:hypothetical protein
VAVADAVGEVDLLGVVLLGVTDLGERGKMTRLHGHAALGSSLRHSRNDGKT